MAEQEVYIKNFPLSFLQKKAEKYFNSEELKEGVKLFDKLKHRLQTLDDTKNSSIIPVEYLKNFLLLKVKGGTLTFKNEGEKIDWLYCRLAGLEVNDLETTPRRFINTSASEIKGMEYLGRELFTNHLVASVREKRKLLTRSDVSESTVQSLIAPKQSGNTLLDIVRKVKFYDKTIHPDYYDDKIYETYIRERIKGNISIPIFARPFVAIKERMDMRYETHDKSFKQRKEYLIKALMTRLKYRTLPTISMEEENTNITLNEHLKIIEGIASVRRTGNNLGANIFVQLTDSHVWTLPNDFLPKHPYKFSVFNFDGAEITHEVDRIEGDSVFFKERRMRKGRLFITYDKRYPADFKKTPLGSYIDSLGALHNKVSAFKVNTDSANRVDIYIKGLKRTGFVYSCHDESGSEVAQPRVEVFDKFVRFTFPNSIYKGQIFILPLHYILKGWSNFKISPDNIKDVLKEYDLLNDELILWKGTNDVA